MIIKQQSYLVESGGLLAEKFFGVQDLGMIFEILRSKLYSNPILAICREISCNARDSHREAGIPDESIIIHLPSFLDPNYKIKDVGVGISPDRAENVIVNYTASTKRNDNTQTGAYGIGFKVPFSYSDSFSVITTYDYWEYSYACYIDETKIGKLALLSKTPTDAHNGTEIIVPVKPEDFNPFRYYTEQACKHWKVKPIIHGGQDIEWQTIAPVIEGKEWAIIKSDNSYSTNAQLIIDGIEYPLQLSDLRKYADPKLIDAARGTLMMYFGIGELSLSANREQIYLDKPTQDVIRDRLQDITDQLKKQVSDKIESFSNLWEANVYYRKELSQVFSNLNFLGKLSWQGITLNSGYCDVECDLFNFYRGQRKGKWKQNPNKIYREQSHTITFAENILLCLNDLGINSPTPKHVKKIFEENAGLEQVQVICPNDQQDEASLNSTIHFDLMQPRKLSEFIKAPNKIRAVSQQRLLIFKFNPRFTADRGSGFHQSSYENMKADVNKKVLCLLTKDSYSSERWININGYNLSFKMMSYLAEANPSISFYGVDYDIKADRIQKEFGKLETLDKFLVHQFQQHKNSFVSIQFANQNIDKLDNGCLVLTGYIEKLLHVDDNACLFLKRLKLHNQIKKLSSTSELNMLSLYEIVNGPITNDAVKDFAKAHPEMDLDKINRACEKKYPLLTRIREYDWDVSMAKDVASYVNLIG